MLVFFTLGSGRSGTLFITDIFSKNVRSCIARHEPPPYLYGNAVRYHEAGRDDKVDRMFRPKLAQMSALERGGTQVYFESTHLFLKSFAEVAFRHLPQMRLIHLVRSPLEVAKSHMNKGKWRVCNENPYSISPSLPIFDLGLDLTEYQKFLVQWIEIENRAAVFVNRHELQPYRFSLHTPHDLNDPAAVDEMFRFFGFDTNAELVIAGDRNSNAQPTVVAAAEVAELEQVVDALPARYLEIFSGGPYASFDAPWLRYLVTG